MKDRGLWRGKDHEERKKDKEERCWRGSDGKGQREVYKFESMEKERKMNLRKEVREMVVSVGKVKDGRS